MNRFFFLVAGVLAFASAARADDGILYYYGSPRLMHGESNIRMVREFVHIRVSRTAARVYCRFVFRNEGQATVARIGFPDGDDHAYEEPDPKTKADIHDFKSLVDGKPVAVKTEMSKAPVDGPSVFHVKTVRFGRGQTHVIEDSYRCFLSGGGTHSMVKGSEGEENLYVSQVTYTMSSGGSWKGNIGSATVQVDFEEPIFRHLRTVPASETGNPIETDLLPRIKPNRVIWKGFVKPKASGNHLIFHRENFKPTAKDDLELSFDWTTYKKSQFSRWDK